MDEKKRVTFEEEGLIQFFCGVANAHRRHNFIVCIIIGDGMSGERVDPPRHSFVVRIKIRGRIGERVDPTSTRRVSPDVLAGFC